MSPKGAVTILSRDFKCHSLTTLESCVHVTAHRRSGVSRVDIFIQFQLRDTVQGSRRLKTNCVGGRHNMFPPPASWPLTLEVVSESRVTWATSVPILVFLDLSVLDLGPMTDRQISDVRRASSLNAPYPRGGGIISFKVFQAPLSWRFKSRGLVGHCFFSVIYWHFACKYC